MAKDLFHNNVKIALQKDGWNITHDPYQLRYGATEIFIDLAAEEAIAAENNTEIYVDRELIQLGVLPKDIILGFRSPSIRKMLAAVQN